MNAAENRTPPKWTDIANDPDFQAADWQTKQRVRGEFYRRAIEPNTPESLRADVQSQFFTRTEADVFGEREKQASTDETQPDTPNLASNALRNAGERGLDLAGNALQFVGNVADRGEKAITDALGGINPGVIGGSADEMRERGYEPDVELGGFGLDFTMRAKPEDTSTGLIDTGQAVEDISLGYEPNYTIDRALDKPSIKTIAGAAAEQGPAALADMAGLVVNLPAYLAARTQEIGEGRVRNDDREGMPEGRDYAVSGPTAAASVLLDRFALGRLLPGGKNAVTSARQIPGAVGRAAGTEGLTEAIQEGGIEYAGESVGTETGWDPVTAGRRAAGGVIVGAPTGGAVRGVTAGMEMRGNNQQGSEQATPAEAPTKQPSPAPQESPSPEAEAANVEAVGTAAELIAKPRFELSSAEREVRDSISYGDAFKALRAAAEERGDSDAVTELDAVSGEISAALEAETMARARNDREALTPIREQLQNASERFTRVMDRLNAPEAESEASPSSANEDGGAQWEDARREQAAEDGIADYDPNADLPDATIDIDGQQQAPEQVQSPEAAEADVMESNPSEAIANNNAGVDMAADIERAAMETNPEPTPAQAEAGNYRKGRIQLNGFDIAIENPKGSTRRGTAPDGTEWENNMAHHYGDIKGTKAADGDNLDVFVGDNPGSERAFIIDQVNADGTYDEAKIMLGFDSLEQARQGYLANYDEGWSGLGNISEMSVDDLKTWTREGATDKPYGEIQTPVAPSEIAAAPSSASEIAPGSQVVHKGRKQTVADVVMHPTAGRRLVSFEDAPNNYVFEDDVSTDVSSAEAQQEGDAVTDTSPEPAAPPAPTLKADGKPFQTRRAVELSKRFRDTPNATPVEVEGGWGFTAQNNAETAAPQAEVQPADNRGLALDSAPETNQAAPEPQESQPQPEPVAPNPSTPRQPAKRAKPRKPEALTPRQQRVSEAFGGAVTGDTVNLLTDVGYAKAGNTYVIDSINKDGTLQATNKERGSSVLISQGEWTLASRQTKAPVAEVAAAEEAVTANAEADDFSLSGSNRTADTATANGQSDLLPVDSAENAADDTMAKSTGGLKSKRASWASDFPRVPFAAALGSAEKHPDYAAAKSGDIDAAKRLVDDIVTEEALNRVGEIIGEGEPVVVPVIAEEATGANRIPAAYSAKIAKHFGLPVDPAIVQTVRAYHTGANADHRLANHAVFDGEVESGKEYLIVDDTMTMGGTLAGLRGHIEENGGQVVGGTTLTGFGDSGQLALAEKMRQDLWKKHGAPLDDFLQQEFGFGIDALTQGEAGHYRKAVSLEAIRDRIAAARLDQSDGSPDGVSPSGALSPAPETTPPSDDPRYKIDQSDARPVSSEDIKAALESSPELSDVTVIQSTTDLPAQSLLMMALQGVNPRDVRGLFVGDQLYVIADNVDSVQDGIKTAVHEAVGHKGIRGVLGEELKPVMRQVYRTLPMDKRGREALDEVLESYPFLDQSNPEHQLTIAEEMIAHLAEKGWNPGPVKRAVSKIRELLRRLFPKMKWTDADVMALSKQSRKWLSDQQANAQSDAEAESDMRFAMATPPGGNFDPNDSTHFSLPDESLKQAALRKMADKMSRLKVTQEAIKKSGGNINEDNDVYLAEELFHGKTERDLNELSRNYVEKLAKQMAIRGIQQEELDAYLYARHAPERNARIAERNPNDPKYADGGSGMTNAEAAAIMQEVEASGKRLRLERLAAIVDDMLAHRREIIREGGLEPSETLDAWDASYEYYVPLKGWANDEDIPVGQDGAGRMRSGRGYEIGGRETKTALGRLSKAASPSTQAIVDTTESVIRKRKNEVGNALLSLITDNPNPDLWQVFTNSNPDTQRTKVEQVDPDTGEKRIEVVERPVAMEMNERYFKTKKAGRTFYIKINDQRLLNAMRNVGPEQNNMLVRTAAAGTRALSAMMTSYNPEFMTTNFARDIQTALLNIAAEQTRDDGKIKGQKIARQTARDIPRAMKAAYRGLADPDAPRNTEWDRWFDEFIEDGAKTGYFDMKDLAGQAKEIKSIMGRANGGTMGNMLKAKKTVADFVENMNGSVENAVRLSAYVNARRAGISRKKAASLAKNLTVNFNRRGEAGTALNAAYMFANASIQGTMNVARTMATVKDTPVGGNRMNIWGRMNAAQKLAVGMAVGSYAMAMFNRMMSDEDDDGELFYDKIPSHVKERNLIIMTGGKNYVRIPLPYGYNIFSNIGTHAESVMAGKSSLTEASKDMTLAILGSFSPIGFQDSEDTSNLVMKNLTPTLLGSVTQVAVNEDFAGRVIFKENFPFGTPKPDSALAFRSTPSAYQDFAQYINKLTRGSEYRSGGVDVSPDVLQHVVNYYGGGAWSFTEKVADSIKRTATGEAIDAHRIPFVGRFRSEVNEYGDIQTFYERRTEIGQLHEEFINLPREEARSFYDEHGGKIGLFDMAKDLEGTLTDLRKVRDAIEADKRLTTEERDEQLDEIEDAMDSEVDFFNLLYNQAEGAAQ